MNYEAIPLFKKYDPVWELIVAFRNKVNDYYGEVMNGNDMRCSQRTISVFVVDKILPNITKRLSRMFGYKQPSAITMVIKSATIKIAASEYYLSMYHNIYQIFIETWGEHGKAFMASVELLTPLSHVNFNRLKKAVARLPYQKEIRPIAKYDNNKSLYD